MAERMAQQGLGQSGAFDTTVQGILEGTGENIASHDAALVGNEVQQRRQEVLQALQIANAIGARTEAATLQTQLAQLDAKLKETQLAQQGQQFGDTMGFNYAQLIAQMNRDAYLNALNG